MLILSLNMIVSTEMKSSSPNLHPPIVQKDDGVSYKIKKKKEEHKGSSMRSASVHKGKWFHIACHLFC